MTAPASSSAGETTARLTYLTVDSLVDGVGASQVTPYLAELSRAGWQIVVHSFEPRDVPARTVADAADLGITWIRHRFGARGPAGGIGRLLRGAAALRGATLVHARGTLPAISALLARPRTWIWDMRGLWTDARIAAGQITVGSWTDRVLRRLERRVALSADGIVTLTERAKTVLERKYGAAVAAKVAVIPTCVDLNRFVFQPMPPRPPVRLVLSGTFGPRYTLDAVSAIREALRRHHPVDLTALVPAHSQRLAELEQAGATLEHPAFTDIPSALAREHVGLCILRPSAADVASMPTKVAEFLAVGRPVVVSREIGDLDALLTRYDAGVVIDERVPDGVRTAAERLLELLDDPDLPSRCRRLAEEQFDVHRGAERLAGLYANALGGQPR